VAAVGERGDLDCEAALAQIHVLLDNELDQVSADAVRAHLAACKACMDDADAVVVMKALIKRACQCEPAPETLVSRISMSITTWRTAD